MNKNKNISIYVMTENNIDMLLFIFINPGRTTMTFFFLNNNVADSQHTFS